MRTPGCIKFPYWAGCGCAAFCTACFCCMPQYLLDYSIWSTLQDRVGQIYDVVIGRQAVILKE